MELHTAHPMSDEASYDLAAVPDHPDSTPTLEVDDVAAIETAPEPEPEPPVAEAAAPQAPPTPPAPPAEPPATTAAAPGDAKPGGPKLNRKKKRRKSRWDMPAWGVSALIHVGIVGLLAVVATGSSEVGRKIVNLDASTVLGSPGIEELTKIDAPPADQPRDQAVGSPDSPSASFSGVGSPGPSSTPKVGVVGRAVSGRTMLREFNLSPSFGGVAMIPPKPTLDLGNGGGVVGDVTFGVSEVGEALDQITHEIRRHLTQHKVSVIWMFDESESMRDDQKAIKAKFDRVSSQLKVNLPEMIKGKAKDKDKKASWPPLTHGIVGFGEELHFEQAKPTENIDLIGRAIDHLVIDTTGKEQTMTALARVINQYSQVVPRDVKMLVVLVTDESGDDGEYVEEARQAAVDRGVPIYVIGRQAIFGHGVVHIRYQDPVTKDIYWPGIRRGPETADFECLQYDGLHGRNDEQPSGFAPYELARLAKDTGGIYFLLPTEEEMRVRQREKAYSIATLKEYVPDYESRGKYNERRLRSPLRQYMYSVIDETKNFPFRIDYPVEPGELVAAVEEQLPIMTERLNDLIKVEKRLKQLEKARALEPERRWQAAYDLMLAQVVAYQVKAYEFRALLEEMARNPPRPSKMPTEDREVVWHLEHSTKLLAPKQKTEKVVAEATRLLNLVVERHPNTPWSDLAKDELNRGMGVGRHEWSRSNKYMERAKLVPKY